MPVRRNKASLVGSWAAPKPTPQFPTFKRLRSGYSINHPTTGVVLGEIQPEKKGTGWYMTFGSQTLYAPTVGPLFTVAGCNYRLSQNPTAQTLLRRQDAPTRPWWVVARAWVSTLLLMLLPTNQPRNRT